MNFTHVPVLLDETIELLNIKPDGIYVDGTAGGGGHSSAILKRLDTGKLISIDRDPDAIEVCRERLSSYPQSVVVRGVYSDMTDILCGLGIEKVDGVLLDIGVSSHQLDTAQRGFSYKEEAPLDMRMSQESVSAADIIEKYTWQELAEIFSKYGEEKFSARIARRICDERKTNPIRTTTQLADIISQAVPAAARRNGNPARKVFQAIRIEVNKELSELENGIKSAFEMLSVGGRLAVITFHSLEDRIVKKQMHEWTRGCVCPPECPICICGNLPKARLVTQKPKEPSQEEIERNPRSRSSKLRVCEKLR